MSQWLAAKGTRMPLRAIFEGGLVLRGSKLLALVLIAAVAVLMMTYGASAKRDAKYVGSVECATCHEDTHGPMLAAFAKTMHRSAMADATKKPAAIVAKFDEDSPFKKEDVKYVLGTGKVYQNYLDKNLKVLPGKWVTKDQKWVKAEPVDGTTQCVGCHVTNFDPAKKTWAEMGVGCESCHGPAGEHVESMEVTDIVDLRKLDAKKLNMVCGQCHAQGTDPSGKLAFSATFRPGDDLAKHFTVKAGATSGLNSQYNGFIESKHAEGGMKCSSCHDTHGDKVKDVKQLKAPTNKLCLGCHAQKLGETEAVKSLEEHAPGAAADTTCAACHMHGGSHTFKSVE